MAREINLIPDVKGEMIKTLKLRNYTLFICIIVSIASILVALVFGLIMGGQQLALSNKKTTLDKMSEKLNSYSDLDDYLTIKDQLGNISALAQNKNVLSRTFNVISALIPTGADTITISSLGVDLSESQPTLTIEAQANAGKEPYIDYNVLDSFKKSMQFMRYDYGRYVDKNGATIPSYCMIETSDDGAVFNDPSKGYYAWWTIDAEGCNPSSDVKSSEYPLTTYNNLQAVQVWRTPQYNDWYRSEKTENAPYMSLDGQISGVPHFESACINYTGNIAPNSSTPAWISSNEDCLLVVGGTDGIDISDSSNGRDESNELVLRFSATINIDPKVFQFVNTHMLATAPAGRRNVTDSYVQIQAIFKERAKDCSSDDIDCINNTKNEEGN